MIGEQIICTGISTGRAAGTVPLLVPTNKALADRVRHMVVPAKEVWIPQVRRVIGKTLCEWGMAVLADDAALIATELATNAIEAVAWEQQERYTESGAAPYPAAALCIHLWLYQEGDDLTIQVWDFCDKALEIVVAGDMSECGRGLFLVNALTKCWGYTPAPQGGKLVWATLSET